MLILSQYFHPEPNGSAPPVTDFAQWLAENGYAPHVITARPSYPERRVYPGYRRGERDRENWRGIAVRRLNAPVTDEPGLGGRLVNEAGFAAALLAARALGEPAHPAVLAVCPSVLAALAAGAFRKKGGRLVVLVHDIQSGLSPLAGGRRVRGVLRRLERAALNRADHVVTLSERMAEVLRDIGVTTPIDVLPPQLDVAGFQVRPEPQGRTQLLYSGAFGRKQGLDQLIDAASALIRRGAQFDMVLRGAGGVEAELSARIEADGLPHVRIEPLVAREQLCEALGAASVHLVPQAAEGGDFAVPSKVFTIMAAGRPFAATAAPGSPLARLAEESGAGLFAPPGDPDALAGALERLLGDPRLRRAMGEAGRRYVENHVDRSIVCPALAAILHDAPDGMDHLPLRAGVG
ncbi:MAG: glycosyltransferase family 4 protein [Oceanicaulis sp.]